MIEIKNAVDYDSDKELELLRRFKNGESSVLDEILNMNYKFIFYILETNYRRFAHIHDDLFCEGYVGLRTAVEKWEEEKHYGFNSYKALWIKKKIRNFIEKESKYISHEDLPGSFLNTQMETFNPIPPNQEKLANIRILLDDTFNSGILTKDEEDVVKDCANGYTYKEINSRLFNGKRLAFFHFNNAKEKIIKLAKGYKMKKVNNKKTQVVENSKGRFFGLTTKRGEVHNARLVNSTDHYLTIFDRNQGRKLRVAKSNVESVTLDGETY